MDKDLLVLKLVGNAFENEINSNEFITVAEIKSVENNGNEETTDKNTALISPLLLDKIKASHVNPFVNRTGVNYQKDFKYNPSFWLYLSKSSGLKKAEPLVVSWESGNHTTLNIDQGFLSTFQLSPRLLEDEIYWDDLSKPEYGIVQNKILSEYKFPTHSEAYVKIKKNYLRDYLFLRKKTAVQIITVKKDILIDNDILELLNGKDYYIEEFEKYEIRIRKYDHKENSAHLEMNGYNILFENSDYVQGKQETNIGHYWKGVEGLVTEWRARHEMPFEHIFVSDEVLGKYEADEDYEVFPDTGGVRFRNQWSISHCNRVGKNAIKIEIKKLYEGNRFEVIDYWNSFSINPSDVIEGENIAAKAKKLTKKYFLFGRLFSKLLNQHFDSNFSPSDIIKLDEEKIEYNGWSDFHDYQPISRHLNLKYFSKDQFLSRCNNLNKLLCENLSEKSLRKTVDIIGFPKVETQKLKSLGLLNQILKYLYIIHQSGLNPMSQSEIIIERVKELSEVGFLTEIFALNRIRQLDSHKTSQSKSTLHNALKDLKINSKAIAGNYADPCEQVYDSLNEMFKVINSFLSKAYTSN